MLSSPALATDKPNNKRQQKIIAPARLMDPVLLRAASMMVMGHSES
jgi:hypothetical protein